jgi:hypothetical protein
MVSKSYHTLVQVSLESLRENIDLLKKLLLRTFDDLAEETVKEEVDKKDTVVLDIPLLIRVLELAREDIKTDVDLHRVVERLIDIRRKVSFDHLDYDFRRLSKRRVPVLMNSRSCLTIYLSDTIAFAREDKIMSKKDDPCPVIELYGKRKPSWKKCLTLYSRRQVPRSSCRNTNSRDAGRRWYRERSRQSRNSQK